MFFRIFIFLESEKKFVGISFNSSSHRNTSVGENRQQLLNKAKRKSVMISVCVVIAYIVCWTPYFVLQALVTFFSASHEVSGDEFS